MNRVIHQGVLRSALTLLCCSVVLLGCTRDIVSPEDPAELLRLGGPMTVSSVSVDAFGLPAPFLSADERARFVVGNAFFRTNWVTAPATTTSRDGLGPTFHASSCSGCHFKDGRGFPPELGEIATGLLIRLSTENGTRPEPTYGYQLATRSILGVPVEASVVINYETITRRFADGQTYELYKPHYTFESLGFGPLAAHAEFSPRLAPQMIGLGLLENVDASYLESIAAEQAAQTTGVSGRVHYVYNPETGSTSVGRFGWKATQPTVLQQTAHAFAGDIGMTNSFVPEDDLTPQQRVILGPLPDGGKPEIEDDVLRDVAFYSATLSVPARRSQPSDPSGRGRTLFTTVGCGSCHRETMHTASQASIPALANVTFHPFTDLLLHDMGEELADNRPDVQASGREWRTPPLWGIGMIPIVNGKRRLLHDGRARTILEAIMWHGGEAEHSREAFSKLSKADRDLLLQFIESL